MDGLLKGVHEPLPLTRIAEEKVKRLQFKAQETVELSPQILFNFLDQGCVVVHLEENEKYVK